MNKRAATSYLVQRPRGRKRLDDVEFIRHVVAAMWPRVDIYRGATELKAGLAKATAGQVAVYATRFADSEICNGGFHQFFGNSTGILYREAVAGFERIGATPYGALLERAGALLGATVPRDRDARNRRLDRLPDEEWYQRFDKIEERYYALRRGPKALEGYARRYIDAHPDEFFVDP